MAQRIGFYTLRKLAQQMCKYVAQFSPVITRAFPENVTLLAALEAANAACALLDSEIAAVETPGV